MKIMRNSKSSNHCYVIFDNQSVKQQKLSYQHKSIVTAILPTHSNTSNSKIGKLPLFSTLRFVKQMFSFWGFEILFPICSFCPFCLFNIVVYQSLTKNQQIFKKKIMMALNM